MMCRSWLIALFAIVSVSAAETRRDREGEPLPPSAIARFGTSRLMHSGIDGEDNGFAFRPDSKAIASWNELSIRLWDLASGRMLWHSSAPGKFHAAVFSPDGKRLAVYGGGGVWIVDATTGKLERTIAAPGRSALAYAPDGKTIATAVNDWGQPVDLWDVATGDSKGAFSVEKSAKPQTMGFSPDGNTLRAALWGTRDGSAIVTVASWNLANKERLADFDPKIRMSSYRLSDDGTLLGTRTAANSLVQLWDTATAKPIGTIDVGFGHFNFDSDSKAVVTSIEDRAGHTTRIGLWEAATCKSFHDFKIPRELGEQARRSPDGKLIATTQRDHKLCLWSAVTGQRIFGSSGHSGQVTGLEFAKKNTLLVTSGGGEICAWNAATAELLAKFPSSRRGVNIFNDNELLIDSGGLKIGDVLTGKSNGKSFAPPKLAGMEPGASFRLHHAVVSGDGKTILGSGYVSGPNRKIQSPYVVLWDVATGKPMAEYAKPPGFSIDELSSDGRTAIAYETKTHANTGQTKSYFPTEYSADIEAIDVCTGRRLASIQLPEAYTSRVTLSDDGHTLATIAGQHGAVPAHPPANLDLRLWELRTGRERLMIPLKSPGHYDPCTFTLSPNGRLVAVSRIANRIEIFDTLTGREQAVLKGHESPTYALRFRGDGRQLASGHMDGSILLWDVPAVTDKLLQDAELETAWRDLASDDAKRANTASWALASTPTTTKFFRERLKPADGSVAERVRMLITDLDSKSFQVREAAGRELATLVDQIDARLLLSMRDKLSDEQAARLKRVFESPLSALPIEYLRTLRAIETLERLGTKEAAGVLKSLAAGDANSRVTREASNALARLKNAN